MNNNECIICYETHDSINYIHKCGKYKIHKSCLYDWLSSHNDQCITCRKELNIGDFILTNDDNEEIEFNLPKEFILEIQNELSSDSDNTSLSEPSLSDTSVLSNESVEDDSVMCKHKLKISIIMLFFLFFFLMVSINSNKK